MKRSYEVAPEQDFKHLSLYMQAAIVAYQEIVARCREVLLERGDDITVAMDLPLIIKL